MKKTMIKFEKLEEKIALDADAQVMGPAIPEGLDYIQPVALVRPSATPVEALPVIDWIEATPVQSLEDSHPLPEDGFIDRDYIWDDNLDALFSSYASDGEITLREARDIVVSSDDGGYISRFEVYQTLNYIYSNDYAHLYNQQSQAFMLLATSTPGSFFDSIDVDVDATHLSEGLHSVQESADTWYHIARQAEV